MLREDPKGKPNNLVPYITRVIEKKLPILNIYGRNYKTKDGTGVRDYIHVMDLAEAHVAALNYILKKTPKYLTLNIGTGIGRSVLEIINTFKEMGTDIPHIFVHRRSSDNHFIVADNKLSLKLLNWSPKRKLVDMCKDCLDNVLCR